MKFPMGAILCSAAFVALARSGSPLRNVPANIAARTNPYQAKPDAARAGAKLYDRECAACHGQNHEGRGKAPALNRPEIVSAPPSALFWILRNGSLWTGMPAFAHLPEAQRWQIIAYLQNAQREGTTPR